MMLDGIDIKAPINGLDGVIQLVRLCFNKKYEKRNFFFYLLSIDRIK